MKSWENMWICCEQILEFLSKVNEPTFSSDMFRVFLFSSHNKLKLTSPTKKFLVQATNCMIVKTKMQCLIKRLAEINIYF